MSNDLSIVADENIPLANEVFSLFGKVTMLPGRNIRNSDLRDADILVTRSVTKVNETLLHNTPVKFVGTCTIGEDHIDCQYLDKMGIGFSSAPGCNAMGVVQYVFCALAKAGFFDQQDSNDYIHKKVGIIGCGNVGGMVYRILKAIGVSCKVYDPFLDPKNIPDLVSFDSLSDCDAICVHTPLTVDGPYPTFHLLEEQFFSKLKDGVIFINAGRGEVVNEKSLLSYCQDSLRKLHLVMDVWENEPNISKMMLDAAFLGSPHIAGYSLEGKLNGTHMVADALCVFLNHPKSLKEIFSRSLGVRLNQRYLGLKETLLDIYDPMQDFEKLKKVFCAEKSYPGFDQLRREYPERREFSHYILDGVPNEKREFFSSLGFGFGFP